MNHLISGSVWTLSGFLLKYAQIVFIRICNQVLTFYFSNSVNIPFVFCRFLWRDVVSDIQFDKFSCISTPVAGVPDDVLNVSERWNRLLYRYSGGSNLVAVVYSCSKNNCRMFSVLKYSLFGWVAHQTQSQSYDENSLLWERWFYCQSL